MKNTALLTLLVIAMQITGFAQASKPKQATRQPERAKNESQLGSNVTFSVFAVRSWTPLETKFLLVDKVPSESFFYLKMDGVSLAKGGPSPILSDEGASDFMTAFKTGSTFTRRCVKFAPPKGKYVEVLLMFHNAGQQTAEDVISGQKTGVLDIALTPSRMPSVQPLDFLSVGFSNSRLSQLEELQKRGLTVVTEFTGKISIYLEADGKTWLLLLFDVPKTSKSATLKIRNSDPVAVNY
jgi:hypothetical protein